MFRYSKWIISISIIVFSFLCSQLVAAEKYDPSHPLVVELVKRGIGYLSQNTDNAHAEGGDILVALAIFKADLDMQDHPRVKKGVAAAKSLAARMAQGKFQWGHDSMYVVPLAAMLLTTIDPVEYAREITTIRDVLLACQRPNGGFGYMNDSPYKASGSGDLSQTQYVMLSFWSMHQANIELPPDAVKRCLLFLAAAQTNDGGWPYQFPEPGNAGTVAGQASGATHSLTAAGLSAFLIAGDILGLFRSKLSQEQDDEGIVPAAFQRVDPDDKKRKSTSGIDKSQVETVYKRGENWLRSHPYMRAGWHYYYVYSKERFETFLEVARGKPLKSPDWYNEGVEVLASVQAPNGSWGSAGADADNTLGPEICTSFAILFLIRSTKKSIGELYDDVLAGGFGLPSDPSSVVVKKGKLLNKSAATNIDDALKMLESEGVTEGEDALLPEKISLPRNPQERKQVMNRFARLLNSKDVRARRFAAKLVGRGDDLDFVPSLVFALSDPDTVTARNAEASLRLISRQLDTFWLPREGDINSVQRSDAILQWRKWYQSVRPDYRFD